MERPIPHHATDRRCYNGALCSDLQREIDSEKDIAAQIKAVEPKFSCTYFPAEGKYMTFVDHKPLTNKFHQDRGDALLEAWDQLVGNQSKTK